MPPDSVLADKSESDVKEPPEMASPDTFLAHIIKEGNSGVHL